MEDTGGTRGNYGNGVVSRVAQGKGVGVARTAIINYINMVRRQQGVCGGMLVLTSRGGNEMLEWYIIRRGSRENGGMNTLKDTCSEG